MASSLVTELPTGGFSFVNTKRNEVLKKTGFVGPQPIKTGTTIVGCVFKDGVVLGADTRATSGNIIADKNCEKIHRLANRIYCCGAGTAADTEMTTKSIESQLELMKLNIGREVPVSVANRLLKQMLYRYSGNIGAALIVGGVDAQGPHIFTIYPHGSTDNLPYTTMGSGCLASMAVFESGWKPDLDEAMAIKLVRDAIYAGITNDLGSGSNVDINIIRMDSPNTRILRNLEVVGVRGEKQGVYTYKKGTTKVLNVQVIPIRIVDEEVMDVDP